MSTPSPPDAPRRPIPTGVVVAGLTILALAGTGLAFTARVVHRADDRTSMSAPKHLVIRAGSADVTITATTRSDLAIRRTASWSGPDAPGTPRSGADGALRLAGCRRPWWKSFNAIPTVMCRTRYDVEVPIGTPIDLRSGTGDVTLVGALPTVTLRGGSGDLDLARLTTTGAITATTGSGDIVLGPGAQRLTVSTGSGDVRGDRLDASQLKASSGSGSVRVTFGAIPTRVTASAGSGDVTIRLPLSRYRITANTGSGSSDVDQVLMDGQSDRIVTARTGSGDVAVKAIR